MVGDKVKSFVTLPPDGLLLPDDQQHLGPNHILAAGEQGLGIIHIFSIIR
jgi:hypothetical protein